MGGEKLKSSRPRSGVFLVFLFVAVGLFSTQFTLYAQSKEGVDLEEVSPVAPASAVDESAIILGEAVSDTDGSGSIFNGGSYILIMLRMILVLALAALAIYGVVFFIKRLARPQEMRDPHLKVLARIPLSNDSFAAVVSLGAKAWLLAGGSGTVNLISEIDEKESLENMLLEDSRRIAESGPLNFRSLLRRFGAFQEGGENREAGASQAQSVSFAEGSSITENLREQRERLRGL